MKAKTLVLSIATLLISVVSFSQNAHHAKKDNLLFLLRQTEHINQALKTVEQLQNNLTTTLKTGEVVIIEKIKQYPNISIMACGLSLTKFNKTAKDLVPGIKYTENGLIKALELQKAGYLSVEL
jgi:intracellular sulfur oxidation DsrE/DsrF family protein